jgi:hypothetical protein
MTVSYALVSLPRREMEAAAVLEAEEVWLSL